MVLHAAHLYILSRLWRMDHLAAADVDATVGGIGTYVAGYRLGHARPADEGVGGAYALVPAGDAIAYQPRAVIAVGPHSAAHLGLADLILREPHG